jgi:hypothetical protein
MVYELIMHDIKTQAMIPKEERHEIYKLMLKIYTDKRIGHLFLGFCGLLSYLRYFKNYSANLSIIHFPELMSHKPDHNRLLWFPVKDRETRLKILKKCIKLTKPESNEKTSLLP